LVSTPGHTSQSLLVHLKNSGFIILSGDVVHLKGNFEKDIVPSLNTNRAGINRAMEKIRQMIATYKAKFFINHDKKQSDTLKLLPRILRLRFPSGAKNFVTTSFGTSLPQVPLIQVDALRTNIGRWFGAVA
jgi:glyoxylase-like metal-dependent hydrolase (beta-lactamase superfamily II)